MNFRFQKNSYQEILQKGKNFLSTKPFVYFSLLGWSVCVTSYLIFLTPTPVYLSAFLAKNNISQFSDMEDCGNSKILRSISTNEAVGIEFELQKGAISPYAGFEIKNPGNRYFKLSHFNRVEVELSTSHLTHVTMYLTVKEKNIRDTMNRLSYRRLSSEIFIENQQQTSILTLSDFKTPDWWYHSIGQSRRDFSSPSWDNVRSIIFLGSMSPLNQTCLIKIHGVRFYRDNTATLLWMACLLLMATTILFMKYLLQENKIQVEEVTPRFVPLKSTEEKVLSGYIFLDYIHEHYMQPELSLKEISKYVGINQRKISETILEKFGCNVRTYINKIRIEESKRLLKETGFSISEIAYKTGYNSVGNFNRVFKTFTNQNPSEYINKIRATEQAKKEKNSP